MLISAAFLWVGLGQTFLESAEVRPPEYVVVRARDGGVLLDWSEAPGAVSYTVWESRTRGGTRAIASGVTELRYLYTGATNGELASYWVAAVDADGGEHESLPAGVEPSDGAFGLLPTGVGEFEELGRGYDCAEGPVWVPSEGGYLLFSDIVHDRQMKWSVQNGIEVFREPSNLTNGAILDGEGRLVICERKLRRVARIEADGSVTPLATHDSTGKRLNVPNDLDIRRVDGSIWFTDPTYGISGSQEQTGNYVFRYDPDTGDSVRVTGGFGQPNGICFSPDESVLYVADTPNALVKAYNVSGDGKSLDQGSTFATGVGSADGMYCDRSGRLYVTTRDGIQIFSANGRKVGTVDIGERPKNITFGGENEERVFITTREKLFASTGYPDLKIDLFAVSVPGVAEGDGINFGLVIKNRGTGEFVPTGSTAVSVWLDGEEVGRFPAIAKPIPAGGALALQRIIPPGSELFVAPEAGTYTLEARVEAGGDGLETDESNNSGSLELAVAEPASRPLQITEVLFDSDSGRVALTWSSRANRTYGVFYGAGLTGFDVAGSVSSEGETTTAVLDHPVPGARELFFRVMELPPTAAQ